MSHCACFLSTEKKQLLLILLILLGSLPASKIPSPTNVPRTVHRSLRNRFTAGHEAHKEPAWAGPFFGRGGFKTLVRRLNIVYYLAHIPIAIYAVVFFFLNMA